MDRSIDVRDGISIAPDGGVYALPSPVTRQQEFAILKTKAERHRDQGRQVVVVQGLGFVGSAVAAVIAGATNIEGEPLYFVIGVDLPTSSGFWKVARLNSGIVPMGSPDPELSRLTHRTVHETGNLLATSSEKAYSLADIIVVDVTLDIRDRTVFAPAEIDIGLDSFKAAIQAIGRFMRPNALVLVETTVPIGASENVVLPILQKERSERGIIEPVHLAHSYERVMPGPNYLSSIQQNWRTFAAIDEASAAKARKFLTSFIDTDTYPLTQLEDIKASELAKLLENSYRAVNIALIYEWTLVAEQAGLNLFDVIDSIRVRKGTHDNMRFPGFGVGGYCLTKDPLLAQWSTTNLLGSDIVLGMTLDAMEINYRMPLHAFDLLAELSGDGVAGKAIAVCGVSYLAGVADTRNAPAELLVDALNDAGANVVMNDPNVFVWPERPDVSLTQDLIECLDGAQGIVFGVPHQEYLDLEPQILSSLASPPPFIVDAQNVISDEKAQALHDAGCRLLGVGKGHWRRQGYQFPNRP